MGILSTFLFRGIRASFVHELRAGDNRLHERSKSVTVSGQRGSHPPHDGFVGEHQRPAERICEQFAAEVLDEILLAALAYVGLHALKSGALSAAGERRLRIHRMSGEIVSAPLTNWAVAFEGQSEGV